MEDKDDKISYLKKDLKEERKKVVDLNTQLKSAQEKEHTLTRLEIMNQEMQRQLDTAETNSQNYTFEKRQLLQQIDRLED